MAGERTLPGLGLTAFWDLGDNTYKAGMDANFRLLSALVQPAILSVSATEPGAPSNGDIHVASAIWGGAIVNDIVIRDDAAWVAVTPQEGWRVYDRATDVDLRFDGSTWAAVSAVVTGLSLVNDAAADRVIANLDLAGNVVIERASAAAQTVTVNTGLSGTEPVTILNTGGGALTFQGTATLLSADGKVAVNTQYASVTLIPKGSDIYYLVGGLE